MPFQEVTAMSLRREFVSLARSQVKVPLRELCRRFQISARTGYKWLKRYDEALDHGAQPEMVNAALSDRSRRPHRSPIITGPEMTTKVLEVRRDHPAWGGRKIRRRLSDLGQQGVPSASTVTSILRRHQMIDDEKSAQHKAWKRFEHAVPNSLWQMDFKGDFAVGNARSRCYPLTVLDDHSRFALALQACANQLLGTVQEVLTLVFQRYGLPEAMTMDNGSPWGLYDPAGMQDEDPNPEVRHIRASNRLCLWLTLYGIRVTHSRPYHPQTQGKDERFHRTLKAEVLANRVFHDHAHCQRLFDPWREMYNFERPHEALQLATPSTRYTPSPRPFPATPPPIVETYYGDGDSVRKVQANGEISFLNREFRISRALRGYPVALRPTCQDGVWQVFFCRQRLAELDLKASNPVTEPSCRMAQA